MMTRFTHTITMTILVILICVIIGFALWLSFQTVGDIYLDNLENPRDRGSSILTSLLSLRLVLVVVLLVLVAIGVLLTVEYRYFRENTRRLEVEVNSDLLTGASSRRYGCDYLVEAFRQFEENGISPGIIIFDLDCLKRINDTHGHKLGDQVLRSVVDVVYQNIRSSDLVIRWGGDEFVVVVHGLDPKGVQAVGDRLVEAVAGLKIQAGSTLIRPSISLGATCFAPGDVSFSDALSRADQALYEAKELGKDRAHFADCDGF